MTTLPLSRLHGPSKRTSPSRTVIAAFCIHVSPVQVKLPPETSKVPASPELHPMPKPPVVTVAPRSANAG